MTRTDPSLNRDKWLADFADQILNGEATDLSTISSDPEMHSLVKTLLRLKNAYPKEELSSVSTRRMRDRILEHWQKEEQKKTRWAAFFRFDWLTPSRRQQFAMAFAVVTVIAVLLVGSPTVFSNGGLAGSAGFGPSAAFLWVALAALLVAIVWLLRRK
jgi:hypothetical protein